MLIYTEKFIRFLPGAFVLVVHFYKESFMGFISTHTRTNTRIYVVCYFGLTDKDKFSVRFSSPSVCSMAHEEYVEQKIVGKFVLPTMPICCSICIKKSVSFQIDTCICIYEVYVKVTQYLSQMMPLFNKYQSISMLCL